MTIEDAFRTAIIALTGTVSVCAMCISHLYFRLAKEHRMTQERLDHCEKKHDASEERLAKSEDVRAQLAIRVARLETGCALPGCPLRRTRGE